MKRKEIKYKAGVSQNIMFDNEYHFRSFQLTTISVYMSKSIRMFVKNQRKIRSELNINKTIDV